MKSLRNNGSVVRLLELVKRYFFVLFAFCLLNIQLQYKSQRIFFWVLFAIVSVITFVYTLPYIFIQLRTYKNTRIVKQLLKQGFQKVEDMPIYYKDITNALLEDTCKKVYLSNKKEQRELFEKYGFIIIVAPNKDIFKYVKQKGISGLFDKSRKAIFIFSTLKVGGECTMYVPSYSDIRSTLYHEWGHFVDYAYNFLSYAFPFYQRYKKESTELKDSIHSLEKRAKSVKIQSQIPYEYKSISEYFAVNYSRYRNKRLLKPGLQTYFENLDI